MTHSPATRPCLLLRPKALKSIIALMRIVIDRVIFCMWVIDFPSKNLGEGLENELKLFKCKRKLGTSFHFLESPAAYSCLVCCTAHGIIRQVPPQMQEEGHAAYAPLQICQHHNK